MERPKGAIPIEFPGRKLTEEEIAEREVRVPQEVRDRIEQEFRQAMERVEAAERAAWEEAWTTYLTG